MYIRENNQYMTYNVDGHTNEFTNLIHRLQENKCENNNTGYRLAIQSMTLVIKVYWYAFTTILNQINMYINIEAKVLCGVLLKKDFVWYQSQKEGSIDRFVEVRSYQCISWHLWSILPEILIKMNLIFEAWGPPKHNSTQRKCKIT